MGEKMEVILVTLIRYPNASEAPRASARGICGEAKRNSAEANPAFRLPQLGLLRGTLRPPVAIPPRTSARGILAKASDSMFHLFKIKASTPIIYDQS